jgi:hypothetical protein
VTIIVLRNQEAAGRTRQGTIASAQPCATRDSAQINSIDVEEIKKAIRYDPQTGKFWWLPKPMDSPQNRAWNGKNAGKEAGTLTHNGYVRIRILGRQFRAHHLAWLVHYGEEPGTFIDHKNRLRADNRIENLRPATLSQNGANSGLSPRNTSGVKGVSWNKAAQVWTASIVIDGKKKHLGSFLSRERAADAYRLAALRAFGEFANPVSVECERESRLVGGGS